MKRWVLAALICAQGTAFGSTTKVGNGDDGADLEGATPVTDGVLVETRQQAVELLQRLNVNGIEGLGSLIPELEHSTLLLAKMDSHSLASEGDLETSADRRLVYARTFSEPYAPTRFFPSALKLSREQLLALHTHEALHRALPPGVREDEDKVALLTMAITSASASFDRVKRVAQSVINSGSTQPLAASGGYTGALKVQQPAPPKVTPSPSKPIVNLTYYNYSGGSADTVITTKVIELSTSVSPFGVHSVGGLAAEPFAEFGALAVNSEWVGSGITGPLTGKLGVRFPIEEDSSFTVFGRMSTKAIGSYHYQNEGAPLDREVQEYGMTYTRESATSYAGFRLSLTGSGEVKVENNYPELPYDLSIGRVLTASYRTGYKFRQLSLGAGLDYHRSDGNQQRSPYNIVMHGTDSYPVFRSEGSFNLIRGGPEVRWYGRGWQLRLNASWTINNPERTSLDDIGDLAGHGAGKDLVSAGLQFDL